MCTLKLMPWLLIKKIGCCHINTTQRKMASISNKVSSLHSKKGRFVLNEKCVWLSFFVVVYFIFLLLLLWVASKRNAQTWPLPLHAAASGFKKNPSRSPTVALKLHASTGSLNSFTTQVGDPIFQRNRVTGGGRNISGSSKCLWWEGSLSPLM